MTMMIYLYDRASESGQALKAALNVREIVHDRSMYRGRDADTVINWGCSELPRNVRLSRVVNSDTSVFKAVNKGLAFEEFARNRTPHVPFTSDRDVVRQWLRDGHRVYARTRTQGFDGAGLIELVGAEAPIIDARLYTQGVDIQQEYRVTVIRPRDVANLGNGLVVLAQRKVKADTAERTTSDTVRVSSNGWGFKLIDHERYLPRSVKDAAISALSALNLDFGGVDVILRTDNTAAVLEVNTAPQLTPTACRRLAAAIQEHYYVAE